MLPQQVFRIYFIKYSSLEKKTLKTITAILFSTQKVLFIFVIGRSIPFKNSHVTQRQLLTLFSENIDFFRQIAQCKNMQNLISHRKDNFYFCRQTSRFHKKWSRPQNSYLRFSTWKILVFFPRKILLFFKKTFSILFPTKNIILIFVYSLKDGRAPRKTRFT